MLRYARVRFWCRWGEEARRIYSPLLWRDDIERALQKTACILPRQDCAECVVYSRCLYAGIFMPNGKPGGKGESTPLPLPSCFPRIPTPKDFSASRSPCSILGCRGFLTGFLLWAG